LRAQRGNLGCPILSEFRLFPPIFVVFVFAVLVVVVVLSSAPNDFLSSEARQPRMRYRPGLRLVRLAFVPVVLAVLGRTPGDFLSSEAMTV